MPPSVTRSYDLVCFGDEVPGILTLVAAAREHRRQTGKFPRSLLLFKRSDQEPIGGHLVRGKLAYLDRSSVPLDVRRSLGLGDFGDPAAIYREFLRRAGVDQIALDPDKANTALRQMLNEANVDLLGGIEIGTVMKSGDRITGILLTKNELYLGKQFIDATVNAELAQAAGVNKLPGFGTLSLPKSELPVTVVFETAGLGVNRLQEIELAYLRRFSNLGDTEAQEWLNSAAGGDEMFASLLRRDLVDGQGNLKTLIVGRDYIDIRSKALSIAYHAFRGTRLSLSESGSILDNGNVALLSGGRMVWNAFLYGVTAAGAEALARSGARPTADMLREVEFIRRWFVGFGATAVRSASELYIRHAGNVTGAVEPLSGADMLAGGVPSNQALGTFGYAFDVRGGIDGIFQRAADVGVTDLRFAAPLFNIGIRHAVMKTVPNLAVISPASGFEGYASSAGRIVEFNVGVGQGIGIACSIALTSGRDLASITNSEVRSRLSQAGLLARVYGRDNTLEASRLGDFEQRLGDLILVA